MFTQGIPLEMSADNTRYLKTLFTTHVEKMREPSLTEITLNITDGVTIVSIETLVTNFNKNLDH